MGKIKVTQVKSKIGQTQRQKKTLEALGLKRINHSVVHDKTPQVMGMVSKVAHLVNVEEIK